MRTQDMFNRVATHLLAQRSRSSKKHGECFYRGPGGKMCAVGCLISDEVYSPLLEGKSASDETVISALQLSLGRVTFRQVELLSELQIIHDGYAPRDWRLLLTETAERHGLKMPEVTP